ncbi:hypothetical protein CDD83_11104 [Cordyceps sp. RAO-2017]|nr:hypothetical protein CDD83_11104 [Cordyceps sp. RAO-2017]
MHLRQHRPPSTDRLVTILCPGIDTATFMSVIARSPAAHEVPFATPRAPLLHGGRDLKVSLRKGVALATKSNAMSYNALQQTESLNKIKGHADELVRIARQFPDRTAVSTNPVCEDELGAMLRLSVDIKTSLDTIASLRRRRENARPPTPAAAATERQRPKRARPSEAYPAANRLGPTARPPKRSATPTCHNCEANFTPIWRMGPDGSTFCNVCGLIYAKRERRHADLRAARRRKTDAWLDEVKSVACRLDPMQRQC